jgi:hypothetical protein
VSDSASSSILTATLSLKGCSVQSGSLKGVSVTGVARQKEAFDSVTCVSLLGGTTPVSSYLTATWSAPSVKGGVSSTSFAATSTATSAGEGGTTFSLGGVSSSGSFAGSKGGGISLASQSPLASLRSSCAARGIGQLYINSGIFTTVFTPSTTVTTLESGQHSNGYADTGTSLCVNPQFGVSAPTGAPGSVTWPSSIGTPSGCGLPPDDCVLSALFSGCSALSESSSPWIGNNVPGDWWTPLSGATWLGTDNTGGGGNTFVVLPGYTVTDFDVPFDVPACSTDTISATAYADGGVAAYLDGHFAVGQQSLASDANFETAPITFPLHEEVGPGAHVIDFIVANYTPSQGLPTIFNAGLGLLYSITRRAQAAVATTSA